jgi:hypothetical protein
MIVIAGSGERGEDDAAISGLLAQKPERQPLAEPQGTDFTLDIGRWTLDQSFI